MKALFQKRRRDFLGRCLKYSRYVLNDHFVLVLLVFLGFLSLQYRQLLEDFPENPWTVYLFLLVLSALLFVAGKPGTYLEEADQHFLLTKEEQVLEMVKEAGRRQFFIWGLVQALVQLLLMPLYLKLGFAPWLFLLFLLLLTIGKFFVIQVKLAAFQDKGIFQWEAAIGAERKRQQAILQFFALFTRVKGLTSTVKRRKFLDGFLVLVTKTSDKTWDYLYLRSFLRSGDFLGLTVRLMVLSLVALLTIELSWLAVGLVLLIDYLLLFQLLALYHAQDYQYLTLLYPLSQIKKTKGFLRVLRGLLYGLLFLQTLLAIFILRDKTYLAVLLAGGFLLNHLYLGIKAKKLVD